MIIYNITYSIEPSIEQDWLQWIKQHYTTKIEQTGFVHAVKLLQLLTEIDNGGVTYTLQIAFTKTENLVRFEDFYEKTLENEHHARYEGKYVSFRTLLKEV